MTRDTEITVQDQMYLEASGFVGLIDPSFLQISSLFQFNQDQGDDVCINLSKPQQLVLTHFVLSSANVTLLLQ